MPRCLTRWESPCADSIDADILAHISLAGIMMNAGLRWPGHERITVPSIYRSEYLQALRALTHNRRADALIAVMNYAQRFVGGIDFSDYPEAVKAFDANHAFGKPADAMGGGDRLPLRNS